MTDPIIVGKDRFLDEALAFAIAHPPCLLVVNTLVSLRIACDELGKHGTVYAMSGEIGRDPHRRAIKDWNSWPENTEDEKEKRFMVVTKPIICAGGFRFERMAYLATSCHVSERVEIQIRGRFYRVANQPTEHLIRSFPCHSTRQSSLPLLSR